MGRPEALRQISDTMWELPVTYKQGMLVPARIVATSELIDAMDDGVYDQVTNVAKLPGIVQSAYCMPDGHWGYGFPIGGVAAMDADEGVISPGGIGFDINCGMRLVLTSLTLDEVVPQMRMLVDRLFRRVPAGVGGRGYYKPTRSEFEEVMSEGSRWCIRQGFGWEEDLDRTEEGGCLEGADPSNVSGRAIERGYHQLGTLGSGNHYLEIQVIKPENVMDRELAEAFGIGIPNQIAVMFHCGSRGFGHQIATDYVQKFLKVMGPKYHISVPDRELSCAPFRSSEGQEYFSAMKCAANMSFANRQMILHQIRIVFSEVFGRSAEELGMHQVYDVAHNTAKLEEHTVDGARRKLLVHRKGATRAFGPGMTDLPSVYEKTGQPVIIGGSMETGSYLLAGMTSGKSTFYSTAHGSGRTMGRRKAKKGVRGKDLQQHMLEHGIYVRTASFSGLAEEAGAAYKDIDQVVNAAKLAAISKPVARLTPLGNVKG
ncbi:MAG: RtcB family protein [Chitinispirillaceae bacterium]